MQEINAKEKFLKIANTYKILSQIDKKRREVLKNSNQTEVKELEYTHDNKVVQLIVMRSPSFKKTIKKVINLMFDYKFEEYPSVDKQYVLHNKNNLSSYDLLYEIDLFTHTLNVAYETLKFKRVGNVMSINVLIALFHDFGKCELIQDKYRSHKSGMPHEKISAMFAKEFLENEALNGNREINMDLIKTIEETITVQHSGVLNKSMFLDDLILADGIARKNEILLVKKNMAIENSEGN